MQLSSTTTSFLTLAVTSSTVFAIAMWNGNQQTAPSMRVQEDSLAQSRQKHVEEILSKIGAARMEPAGEVFENVEFFAQVPAERLLRIMDIGFGRSLGVDCTHCHSPEDWSSDEKRPKRAARDMLDMVRTINQDLLGKLESLDSDEPAVNCTTCHRGDLKPALDMP